MFDTAREKQRLLFESERKRFPHLFDRAPMIDNELFLRWIGIEPLERDLMPGYIKYAPQDFIVEEISPDGFLRTVDFKPPQTDNSNEEVKTIYADLVKIGISTLDFKIELANLLGIEEKNIGFAGNKDRLAITSQLISIRNFHDLEMFCSLNEENFFLKNIRCGKGVVANGELKGNRFIIAVRTLKELSHADITKAEKKISDIKERGFWNFFYFQRFGTPRLISHWLGLSLIKGQYEETIRKFLSYQAPRELPYFKNIRKDIGDRWQDWSFIKEKIKDFPYHFYLENKIIDHLIDYPQNFL